MNRKHILFAAAFAAMLTACGSSNKSADSAAADSAVPAVDSTEILRADSVAKAEAARTDSIAKADSIAKVQAESKSKETDAEVDKIVGIINQHIDAVKDMKEGGLPSTSSMAFRALSNLPEWEGKYKKIKGQLTPEQDARIKAAEKKLKQLIASWY